MKRNKTIVLYHIKIYYLLFQIANLVCTTKLELFLVTMNYDT